MELEIEHNQISRIGCGMAQKKRFGQTEALGAGSETRTRTTVKSQVFETSASTIPPFPQGATRCTIQKRVQI